MNEPEPKPKYGRGSILCDAKKPGHRPCIRYHYHSGEHSHEPDGYERTFDAGDVRLMLEWFLLLTNIVRIGFVVEPGDEGEFVAYFPAFYSGHRYGTSSEEAIANAREGLREQLTHDIRWYLEGLTITKAGLPFPSMPRASHDVPRPMPEWLRGELRRSGKNMRAEFRREEVTPEWLSDDGDAQ